ncbi:hypothetical protein ABPG73_020159 [Tetrahymena malaccensis]
MKLKSGMLPIISYFSRKFYTINYHQIIRGHQRGQFLSLFLLLGKGILFLLLGLYNSDYVNVVSVDNNLVVLSNNDQLNQWQTYDYADFLQAISLVFNLILIIYLVSCYFDFIIFGYKTMIRPAVKKSFPQHSSFEIEEDEFLTKLNKKMQLKIYELMSIYISIYQFLLSTPILYYSLVQILHPLAPINLLLTLISGTLIIDSDFDYSINSSDCMNKPYNPYNVIIYYLDFLIMLLIINTHFNLDTLLLGIYFLINGWFSCRICTYYQLESRFWNTFTYFYCGAICLTFYFSFEVSYISSVPSLMLIIYVPIFYKLTQYFCNWQEQTHSNLLKGIFEEKNQISLDNIDRIIRLQVVKDLQNQNVNDSEKIGIYSLIIKRKQQFQCEQINQLQTQTSSQLSMQILINEIESGQNENQSVLQFLKEQIQIISTKKSEINNRIVFLQYLLEVMKCYKAYFYEFQQIRKQNLGLKQEQILMTAHVNFQKQRQIVQQTLKMQNTFDQQFYSVLHYEEKIQKTILMMDQAVQQKVEFISLLKNKQIQVLNLVKKTTELRKIQLKVRNSLNELSIVNNSNKDLINLQLCYLETLSFQEKDLIIDLDQSYLREINLSQIDTNLLRQKFKIRQDYANLIQDREILEQNQYSQNFNLFNKHSCVIYAKVEENFNLSIQKVSSTFSRLFDILQKDAVDKKIEILMPPNTLLIKNHKQYILSYFQNQNNDVCYLKNKMLFGYSQKGFIFPIKSDVRLNYCNGLNQIGITAYIQHINDGNDYILFQSDSLNVIGVTQNLMQNIFLKNNTPPQKQTDLGQFFPFLYKLKQESKAKLQQEQMKIQEKQFTDSTKVNSLKEFLSQSSNINQKTTTIQEVDHLKHFKFQNQEYLLIIQNQSSNIVKNSFELQNFSFIFVELSINQCEYKDIDNLLYLTISKIKIIQPESNSSIILKYLKEYQEFYSLVFTKNTLETLQAEIESQIKKLNSQDISNQQIHQKQQKIIQNQFCQNQITQTKIEEFVFSENKSQDFQNQNENQTLSPRKYEQFSINNNKNQCIYNIQEENSQIATLSEQQSQIYPQKKVKNLNSHECPQLINNNYFTSRTDVYSQNFISQQDILSKINIQYDQEEILKYGIPLTSNRKDTNRELMSEINLISQTNINSPKQMNDENQFLSNLRPDSLKNEQDESIKGIVSLKLINQGNHKQENQIQIQSVQDITSLQRLDNNHQIASQQKFFQDQEMLSQNFQNLNETKETTQKHSQLKKKQKNKQKLREDQFENNSSSLSRESTSSTKKRLIKQIKKQISLSAIRVVIFFGILTYIVLTIITVQQYFNFIDSVDSMNQNLNSQNWPYEIQNVISRSVKNLNIMHSERQNNFTFPTQQNQHRFDDYLLNQLHESQNQFMSLLQTMDFSVSGKMLYDRISDYQSSFYIDSIYNSANLSKTPSRRTTYNFEQKNSSLLYSIIFINYYIYQQSINPTGKLQEICILQNLQNIIFGIKDTQNYFQSYQNSQVNQILYSLTLQIGIIMIISALCLLSTLPLYAYVQKRKDKIIHLFCTFPVSQLQNIIIKIRSSYYQNKAMSPHIKNIPLEIQILNYKQSSESQNHKKQTLSQITKLPKISYSLITAILISYILLSFYPVFNRIFVQKYLDNLDNNLMMLEYLNMARSNILQSSGLISFAFDMKVYPKTKIVQLTDYIPQIQQVISQTSSLLTNLTIVSNQFNLNMRYQQQQFDDFFFPMFEDDMCTLIAKNPQYIQNTTNFKPEFCKTIYNGFLQKGLKLSIKQFSQRLQELYAIINIEDEKILSRATLEIFKTFNIEDFSNLIDYLDEIINIMKFFLLSNCNEYYQYLKEVQLILIIFQLVLIAIIFGFCWYIFSTVVASQITKIKHHLQVMNVNHLLENNFILTFVKNNIKL